MEYLSSGRPLIAYKLDGIPDEYDEFVFYVNGNDTKALANKIVEVCELDKSVIGQHCDKAYDFVIIQKNSIAQTQKIINLIRNN